MKKIMTLSLMLLFIVFFITTIVVAADDDNVLKNHPGYVNFDKIKIPGQAEESVEIYIDSPILQLVAGLVEVDEPELAKVLSKLFLIRVNTFSIDQDIARELKPVIKNIEKSLQKQKWEKIVRVREKDNLVNVYLKTNKENRIVGITIMEIDNNEEAVFVNIVGETDWKSLSKIGQQFKINQLEDLNNDNKIQ